MFCMLRIAALLLLCLDAAADNKPPLNPARALSDRVFEPSAARVARGEYLVNGILQCFICHSERDWSQPGAPPVDGEIGAGHVWRDDGLYRLVAPNLTPDDETGIGRWSDDALARAIREGVGHDGRALSPAMWYRSFRDLSDEDLAAVIVYLRSLEPIRNPLPPTLLSDEEAASFAPIPRRLDAPVVAPDAGNILEYGRYLAGLADCSGCHTAWSSPRIPGELGGGNSIELFGKSAFSTNITRHASGLAYSAETFAFVMRTGKAGTLHGLMPWVAFQNLSDADLNAIYAALTTAYPVAHYVGNAGEPTMCAVCETEHPLGESNVVSIPAPDEIDTSILSGYVGTFRSADYGFTITVRRDGDSLRMRAEDFPEIGLVALSETVFAAPGGIAPIEFVADTNGVAQKLISRELRPLEFDRVVTAPD